MFKLLFFNQDTDATALEYTTIHGTTLIANIICDEDDDVPPGSFMRGVLDIETGQCLDISGVFSGHPKFVGLDGQEYYITPDYRILNLATNPPPPLRLRQRRFALVPPPFDITEPIYSQGFRQVY